MQKEPLDSEEAYCLWVLFGSKIGIKALRDSYGPYWPRHPLLGELVYGWWDNNDDLIGWTAIRRDVLEPLFWINVGIFPDQRGKGYSKEIFWATIKMGFEAFTDATWCFSAISKRNPKPFSYTRRDTEWSYVGEMVMPEPGYTIYGLSRKVYGELINA